MNLAVLKKAIEKLPEDWERYEKPQLNGLNPDYVLINPKKGFVLIWLWKNLGRNDLGSYEELFPGNALYKSKAVEDEIYSLYCPRLKRPSQYGPVLTIIADLDNETQEFRKHISHLSVSSKRTYINSKKYRYFGKSILDEEEIGNAIDSYFSKNSTPINETLKKDFTNWLTPSLNYKNLYDVSLDKAQLNLAKSKTGSTGMRRIKGPAGSGKSVVLAVRAAELAMQEKRVLVVTFNITLIHYLRLICYSYEKNLDECRIEWRHFHLVCKNIICVNRGIDEYTKILERIPNDQDDDISKESKEANEILRDSILQYDIPNAAKEILTGMTDYSEMQYDAILVDEGQDFTPEWWELLKMLRKKDGEMMLAGDWTQDIYGKGKRWNLDAMKNAGFSGAWNELNVSYRMPNEIIELCSKFVEMHIEDPEKMIPMKSPLQSNLFKPFLHWRHIGDVKNLHDAYIEEILALVEKAEPDWLAMPDITFLCPTRADGLAVNKKLNDLKIRTAHTFSEDKQTEQKLKLGFHPEIGLVRGTTIHSFKGWESRSIVIMLKKGDVKSRREFYTAMTRLKYNEHGSYLVVVSSNSYLKEFGKEFPSFVQK